MLAKTLALKLSKSFKVMPDAKKSTSPTKSFEAWFLLKYYSCSRAVLPNAVVTCCVKYGKNDYLVGLEQ